MAKYIDLTNKKFGRLTAVKRIKPEECNSYKWLCECDCGNTKLVSCTDLKLGKVRSCGCLRKEANVLLGKSKKKYNDYTIKDNTVYVALGNNDVMKCDVEDWDRLKGIKWTKNSHGYAVGTNLTAMKKLAFHRAIIEKRDGFVVDHINRDKLDNRKCNLRYLTPCENLWNKDIRCNNTTGATGVNRVGERWVARIKVGRKNLYLGTYDTKEDAIEARKNAEVIYQPLPERLRRDNP